MTLTVLALATPWSAAQAGDLGTPLPPLAVQATATDAGPLVTWLPPASEGHGPVLAYHVYRFDPATVGWYEVGSTDAATLSFVDDEAPAGFTAYTVGAENEVGSGPQSLPAPLDAACDPVGIAGIPPQVGINWDCIGNTLGSGPQGLPPMDAMCDPLIVAGIPPQVGINWDCIGNGIRVHLVR